VAAVLAVAGVALAVAGIAGIHGGGGKGSSAPPQLVPGGPAPAPRSSTQRQFDPLAYRPALDKDFARRAAFGAAHVLYAKSPGGVLATAQRVSRFRGRIEHAAAKAGVDPDELEGLVFLESAGRPRAVAGGYPEGAVGLTQILAETGQDLLKMKVDVPGSRRLLTQIAAQRRGLARDTRVRDGIRARARARGRIRIATARQLVRLNRSIPQREATIRRLIARRPHVDERLDPVKSLAATGRYLQVGRLVFGTPELALVSYHMGLGNLTHVIRAYTGDSRTAVGKQVQRDHITYARLYFDSTPLRHARAQRMLSNLGDDSETYLWRVRAAEDIMHLWRTNRAELQRMTTLETNKNSAEEVLHPRDQTKVYANPDEIRSAVTDGILVRFAGEPGRRGYARSKTMGEQAGKLHEKRSVYAALRPEALAGLRYLAAGVRSISKSRAPLLVTSTIRDREYQKLLIETNSEATRKYSLHTTGFAFDIRRSYASKAQALAFQYMLDRLTSLGLIAWVREPAAIHVTVASDAKRLEAVTGVKP
jgi:hypothetical protein